MKKNNVQDVLGTFPLRHLSQITLNYFCLMKFVTSHVCVVANEDKTLAKRYSKSIKTTLRFEKVHSKTFCKTISATYRYVSKLYCFVTKVLSLVTNMRDFVSNNTLLFLLVGDVKTFTTKRNETERIQNQVRLLCFSYEPKHCRPTFVSVRISSPLKGALRANRRRQCRMCSALSSPAK